VIIPIVLTTIRDTKGKSLYVLATPTIRMTPYFNENHCFYIQLKLHKKTNKKRAIGIDVPMTPTSTNHNI
jgi:hypothetical protein